MYALIDGEFEAHEEPCYKSFTELLERGLALAKMGVMLDVFVCYEGRIWKEGAKLYRSQGSCGCRRLSESMMHLRKTR